MRLLILLVVMILLSGPGAIAQNLISSKPAKLQVFGRINDGRDAVAESTNLNITSDGQYLKGILPVSSLSSIDPDIQQALQDAQELEVRFEIQTQQDLFAFGKSVDEKVTLEGDIFITGREHRNFIMDFIVTQKKTNNSNTFLIRGRGNLSLSEHFGIETPLLEDKISFQFNLNFKEMNK